MEWGRFLLLFLWLLWCWYSSCSCALNSASCGVFCAGNETKAAIFSLALKRSLTSLWYRSAGNSKECPNSRPLCIVPRKDNFVSRPCALTASSHGCRSDWTPHFTSPHSALQAFYSAKHEVILSESKALTAACRSHSTRAG